MKKKSIIAIFCMFLLAGCGKQEAIQTTFVSIEPYNRVYSEAVEATLEDVVPYYDLTLTCDNFERKSYIAPYEEMVLKETYVMKEDLVHKGEKLMSFQTDGLDKRLKSQKELIQEKELLLSHYENMLEINPKDEITPVMIEQIKRDLETANLELQEIQSKMNSYGIFAEENGVIVSIASDYIGLEVPPTLSLTTIIYSDGIYRTRTDIDYPFEVGETYIGNVVGIPYPIRLISIEEDGAEKELTFQSDFTPETFCSVELMNLKLEKEELKNALTVPVKSVIMRDDKTYVYELDQDGYKSVKEIQCGEIVDEKIVVLSGLEEGSLIAK